MTPKISQKEEPEEKCKHDFDYGWLENNQIRFCIKCKKLEKANGYFKDYFEPKEKDVEGWEKDFDNYMLEEYGKWWLGTKVDKSVQKLKIEGGKIQKEKWEQELIEVLFQYGLSAHKITDESHIYSFSGIVDMNQIKVFIYKNFISKQELRDKIRWIIVGWANKKEIRIII